MIHDWGSEGWVSRAELPALLNEAARIYEAMTSGHQGESTVPQQTGKNSLLSLLGDKVKKAHERHKSDETDYGFANLPEGISGGVARLVMAKWGKYGENAKLKGQPFVTFQGVILLPKEHAGVPVAGQRATQTIPLCDQPDKKRGTPPKAVTFDDNYADLLNELRKLGVNTEEISVDDLETTLQALQESKPCFRFSTRGWTPAPNAQNPKPDRMVFTEFTGVCEDPESGQEPDAGAGTDDDSGGGGDGGGDAGTPPGADADGALSELADLADAGDEDAMDKLRQIAKDNGVEEGPEDGSAEPNTINGVPSYAELVALIEQAQAGGGGDDTGAESGEPEAPEKGSMVKYAQRDAKGNVTKNNKTKKPVEAAEHEVVSINADKKTVVLKNPATKALHKDVKWEWLDKAE